MEKEATMATAVSAFFAWKDEEGEEYVNNAYVLNIRDSEVVVHGKWDLTLVNKADNAGYAVEKKDCIKATKKYKGIKIELIFT